MIKYSLKDLHNMDDSFKDNSALKLFFTGFVIYSLGYTMSITVSPIYIICDLMRLIGVCLLTLTFIRLASWRFENIYLKTLYSFFLFWSITVVFRGFKLDYEFLKNSLFDPSGFFLYLAPLILLVPKPPKFYRYLFHTSLVLGGLFFIHVVLDITAILDRTDVSSFGRFEVFMKFLALPSGFILITFYYQPKRTQIFTLLLLIAVFILALFRARRGLMFITSIIFIFTLILSIYINKRKILLIFLLILSGILATGYTITTLNISNSNLFAKAKERGAEDTRSGVEIYYYNDMQFQDWVVGRGMSGMVAAPIGIDINSKTPGYRNGIETDYLNIILKGGLISLGLLMLITIPAIIQGLFLSKNLLTKASALWIVLWTISLYPSTVTTFSLNYLLVWVAVGICYSKPVRQMPDEVLRDYFLTNNFFKN